MIQPRIATAFILSAVLLVTTHAETSSAPAADTPVVSTEHPAAAAATALIGRVLGGRATDFSARIIPGDIGSSVFEIESVDGKIVLRGDNGVSIASALNHYLKNFARCHLSWCGDQLALPPRPSCSSGKNPHRQPAPLPGDVQLLHP